MALNVEFVGLACFRLWDDEGGPVVVTDPYTPFDIGMPEDLRIDGDLIIASSDTDTAHYNPGLVKGDAQIVNALELTEGKTFELGGRDVAALAVTEDPSLKDSAKDCAMYGFRLGGLDVVHMGDAGYVPSEDELRLFAGRCDVLLILAGILFTPPLEELDRLIDTLQPKWIIPMHYFLPPMIYAFRTEADFVAYRAGDPVVYTRSTQVRLPLGDDLGATGPVIVVLEAAGLAPA
jgi:L-ascorbate metabolism protein UlaG (beta-lactamase superfamily)